MSSLKVEVPQAEVAEFCQKNKIRRLSVFGSALRNDFRDDSDIDLLIEFEPGCRVGFIRLGMMEGELSDLLGRKADLKTPGGLSPYFRDEVLKEAKDIYVAA
jgi:uncharacterized protein